MAEPKDTIDVLARAYRGDAEGEGFHGPALRPLVLRLDPSTAGRRALPGAHTAREILRHVVLWREWACDRLEGGSPADLDDDGWVVLEGADARAWADDVARLDASQERLLRLAGALDAAAFERLRHVLRFVLHHDLHHGGQLALLRHAPR
jgi:hypothetical protein